MSAYRPELGLDPAVLPREVIEAMLARAQAISTAVGGGRAGELGMACQVVNDLRHYAADPDGWLRRASADADHLETDPVSFALRQAVDDRWLTAPHTARILTGENHDYPAPG